MKTKNNVQKAVTKSLAVIISLVLISITVNAQDFWKSILENNSFSQIAMVMAESTETSPVSDDATGSKNADSYSELFAPEYETSLEVESWMLDEAVFFNTINYETEVDNDLEFEDWMTNENLFMGLNSFLEVEPEPVLEVEEWMYGTDHFEIAAPIIVTETEEALELESWMTDTNVWKM